MAVRKTKKKASKKQVTISWWSLVLGFEADWVQPDSRRDHHIRSARMAIEKMFTERALRRWTDGSEKKATVEMGRGHVKSLAQFVAGELNAGLQDGVEWRFVVYLEEPRPDAPMVDRDLKSRDPGVVVREEKKPGGVKCYWYGDRWMDSATYLLWLRSQGSDASARRSQDGLHLWVPDARHPMIAQLEYDCPYKPSRDRSRS